jgi:hypothetical protein
MRHFKVRVCEMMDDLVGRCGYTGVLWLLAQRARTLGDGSRETDPHHLAVGTVVDNCRKHVVRMVKAENKCCGCQSDISTPDRAETFWTTVVGQRED